MIPENTVSIAFISLFSAVALSLTGGGDRPSEPAPGRELSQTETQLFLEQVSDNLGSLETLRVDFLQERRMSAFVDTLKAKGTCYFQAPDRIRWELKEPYHSALVFNQGKVAKFLFERDTVRKLNPGAKEIMREVLKLICQWMQGDFESSEELFDMRVERGDDFLVHLTPSRGKMRDIIQSIELSLDGKSKHISKVTIQESPSDRIVITFLKEQWNIELDKDLFSLD